MGGGACKGIHHACREGFGGEILRKRTSQVARRQRSSKRLFIEYPRFDMALIDIDADEMVEPFLGKRYLEHAGVSFLSIADEEILPAEIPLVSLGEIGNSLHIPVVRFHGILLVFQTRIAWAAKTPRVMPRRHFACTNWMQKRRRGAKPLLQVSLYPGYLPASSPSLIASRRNGVEPLCMGSSIAAMPAMRVDAHHAKRQVYQPGLNPLSRARIL